MLLQAVITIGSIASAPWASQSAPQVQSETPGDSSKAGPPTEFLDQQGRPLPPEVQAQLRRQFEQNPLKKTEGSGDRSDRDVVVSRVRQRGAVIADFPPERRLGVRDIKAFGAASIGELLDALGQQVISNRSPVGSRPIVLLNGKRVADFSEIAQVPTEAIERMEIFPEELALSYGYRPDQKIVNVVTFERFRSSTMQMNAQSTTDGGREGIGGAFDHFGIRKDARFGFGASYNRATALLESERQLTLTDGDAYQAGFRTLLPTSERLSVNGSISGYLIPGTTSTFNLRLDSIDEDARLGILDGQPVTRTSRSENLHLGTSHSGRVGDWQWSLVGNRDRSRTDVLLDRSASPFTRDAARTIVDRSNLDLLASGSPITLPGGPMTVSASVDADFRRLHATSSTTGVQSGSSLGRDQVGFQLGGDVPLTSRNSATGSSIGDLSVNATVAASYVSDFDSLLSSTFGVVWTPIRPVDVTASITKEDAAPSIEQLGSPLIAIPNFRTFDFARNEVVDVERLAGGNRSLRAEERQLLRVGVVARPLSRTDLSLSVDLVASSTDNPIATLQAPLPELVAAFPDRFRRDRDGRLIGIDGRPLNLRSSRQKRMRWGFNLTRPIGPALPYQSTPTRTFTSEAEARRAYPGAVVMKAEPGSPIARRMENQNSRLYVSAYHTWTLEDVAILGDERSSVDLLGGGAIDPRGGRRRHEVEVQAGAFRKGIGVRASAVWQSGLKVRGSTGEGDLSFSSLATIGANIFVNLGDRFATGSAPQWAKGMRISVGVTNVLNTRPLVRSSVGTIPVSYQRPYLDPLGRVASLSLRKLF